MVFGVNYFVEYSWLNDLICFCFGRNSSFVLVNEKEIIYLFIEGEF